jgi:hypothetical protein
MDDVGRPAISRKELYAAAVGEPAARYYVPKFLAFEDGTKRFSFNVWALLFGAFWFCYRRMWISALMLWIVGTWLVGFLTSTTLLSLGLTQLATPIVSIASALYIGVILPVSANYLYYSSVGQRITHLREKFVDDAEALSALNSRSGELGRPGNPGGQELEGTALSCPQAVSGLPMKTANRAPKARLYAGRASPRAR